MNDASSNAGFIVGGVKLERPFKIRRLGHFGVDVVDVPGAARFYCDLLGFAISDSINFNRDEHTAVEKVGSGLGYFLRHGTDHHSFVLFPLRARRARPGRENWPKDVTINQITWQVGSLCEVVEGNRWLESRGQPIDRRGRDTPGSNWHTYPIGPGFHINEIYYGIEQVGWDGLSKPMAMHSIKYDRSPSLPQVSEAREVEEALSRGIDIHSGHRHVDRNEARYDVGGVLLPRPFKIVRVGPVRLFADDVDEALGFYRDVLGLAVTEEIVWRGHRCVFLRANTEHHSMALYPRALRSELGLSEHTTLMAFGLQLGDYAQLRGAAQFLEARGVTLKYLPPELCPGIDYSLLATDPEGHAMQLYHTMEQIGWDGKPRPAGSRRSVDNRNWPETLEPMSDSHAGEVFLGPLG
jgi:catechol 2,3-dioxygenase-like lactoylglutathione lyase family enzyme